MSNDTQHSTEPPSADAESGTPTDTGPHVELRGRTTRSLSLDELAALPTVERVCTVTCASGDRTTATWTGVPVSDLLSSIDAPPTTTHLRVASDDGYCACIAVTAALDGLLAVSRDGSRLADTERYGTRFVGPSVDGERAVKGVVRIEPLELGADDDPTEWETLSLDDSTYG